MPRHIEIETGSRLHFGPLSNRPDARRFFGGVGTMLNSPGFAVAAQPAATDTLEVTCSHCSLEDRSEILRRVGELVSIYRAGFPGRPQDAIPACRLEICRAIPPHVGLGSGTQLALAVAAALAALGGDNSDPNALALRMGRGVRSALGIHGFARGGFLVDGGKSNAEGIGTLAARAELPPEWRFVLVTPVRARGLSGEAERDAFARLPAMDEAATGRLCRIVLMDLLPSALEADFAAFSEAVFDFGRVVGEYFAPVQGGTYSDKGMQSLVASLRQQGIRGIGQTSWGPTIFALCPGQATADSLLRNLMSHSHAADWHIQIAAPRNTGTAARLM